ncbi:toll/interleukin-1 receptor domain-containing protein [Deinococcus multiflagellatus]|uniref:Toll/interleukin-1 receptor domain-containing protein n=1 Tax=Deinococcus multiflagellatus TaxID=1656887 RepID=A0ABW1ZPU5_9DEIO|nr:toll/interleukin-1 receptor domain-containing protein [Deinococcus multiflagellatus]MBZ9714918.1 toll/interleukin-1 receptor domain-containing protein [Deinococcus multiflagellatus]
MTHPLAFLSYARNTPEYRAKVDAFARRLRTAGVEVILDQWHLKLGQDMNHFMERSVERADKVLLLLDPTYKQKADGRTGGVGTETQIVSAEVYRDTENTKFLPVLFELGDQAWEQAVPRYLQTRIFSNLVNPDDPEQEFNDLVDAIYGVEPDLPPIGPARYPRPASSQAVVAALVTLQLRLGEERDLVKELMSTPPASWHILDTDVDVQQALNFLETGEWLEQRVTRAFVNVRGAGKVATLQPRGKLTKLLVDQAFIQAFNQASQVTAVVETEIEMQDAVAVSSTETQPASPQAAPQVRPEEQLVTATAAYVAGLRAIPPHRQAEADAAEPIEALVYPVLQALGALIPTGREVQTVGECLGEIARTLRPHGHTVNFDTQDMNLGRGAYLAVLGAMTLATAHRQYAFLDELMHTVVSPERFGSPERLLGETRYYYLAAIRHTLSDSQAAAEKARFYDRLFNPQNGWLIPYLPRRLDPRLYEIEGDFVGDVAFAYAWQREYPGAGTMKIAVGQYLAREHAHTLKAFLRRDYSALAAHVPDFATATAYLVHSYAQRPDLYRAPLIEAMGELL